MPAFQKFNISTFQIDGQHIREYARATAGRQEDVLKLEVKRYNPVYDLEPRGGGITIVATHGNGFPKELYEPLWESLVNGLAKRELKVNGIWIADVASQGQSGLLNRGKLGNDPSGFDHSRDLLQMINHFRHEMTRPLFGIGHSMGGCHLANLANFHPRLFSGLVLIEPVIQITAYDPSGPTPASTTIFRRDTWPSRAEAETAFRKSALYKQWHPKVFDLWMKYGIVDVVDHDLKQLDTAGRPTPVTLTTTKHQESFLYVRPCDEARVDATGRLSMNHESTPDLDPHLVLHGSNQKTPPFWAPKFYRPEPTITFHQLPHLRPPTLFIFGDASNVYRNGAREDLVANTGTGYGGSGGAAAGKVASVVLPDGAHTVPMVSPEQVAKSMHDWLAERVEECCLAEAEFYVNWDQKSSDEKTKLGPFWIENGNFKRPPKL